MMTIYDMDQLRQQRELREEAEREMFEGRQKMTNREYSSGLQGLINQWEGGEITTDQFNAYMEDLRLRYLTGEG